MEFKNLWATPIAFFKHPNYEALNQEILMNDELRNFTHKGKKNLWDIKDSVPAIAELHDWILDCTAKYAEQCFDMPYRPDYFKHSFGTINYRGPDEQLLFHTHRWQQIVMTYYIQVPTGCGDIRLIDPRTGLGWVSMNKSEHYNQYTHTPSPGEMIMFPAWVIHGMNVNKTPIERVAITSNVNLKSEYSLFVT